MLYGTECWVVKKQHIHKMSVVEMRMSKWIGGNIMKDRMLNEEICLKIDVASIDEKMRESHLIWLDMFKG